MTTFPPERSRFVCLIEWLTGTSPRFDARCRLVAYLGALSAEERERQTFRAFAVLDHYQRAGVR